MSNGALPNIPVCGAAMRLPSCASYSRCQIRGKVTALIPLTQLIAVNEWDIFPFFHADCCLQSPDPKLMIVLITSDEVRWHNFMFNNVTVRRRRRRTLWVISSVKTNDSTASSNFVSNKTLMEPQPRKMWLQKII